MLPQEIQPIVIDVLCEVQKISGRQWKGISLDAKPIDVLEGFDSLSGVEATVMIEEKIGYDFGLDSVFVSDNGKRALTVQEIAERVAKFINTKGVSR